MDFNKNHPKRLQDEVFITKASNEIDPPFFKGESAGSSFSKIGWKTKRRGEVSYSPTGEVLGNKWKGSFPVFAKISEMEAEYPGITKDLLPNKAG